MSLNIQNSTLQITAGLPSQFPSAPLPQVALSGRSNVGKSSLINTMLSRKALARVSSSPGKTVTVNFYNVDKKLYLADLPGYGFAKRSEADKRRWSSLTDGYFTSNKNIDRLSLVVQLVDCKVGYTQDDLIMLNFLSSNDIPYVIVATKTDKLGSTAKKQQLELISSHPLAEGRTVIPFSSHTGEGRQELWSIITQHCAI